MTSAGSDATPGESRPSARIEALPVVPGWAEAPVLNRLEGPPTAVADEAERIVWAPNLGAEGLPRCRGLVIGTERVDPATVRDASYPIVAGVDGDLLRTDERARIDGGSGSLVLEGVRELRVVTAFLQRPDGKVLLLRRSGRVGSFRGRWAGVSGFIEEPTAEAQAFREIREETGFEPPELALAARGRRVFARDDDRIYVVHPFRFRLARGDVRLDWEHTEAEWVDPGEIDRRETVPKLDQAWRAVAGAGEPEATAPDSAKR